MKNKSNPHFSSIPEELLSISKFIDESHISKSDTYTQDQISSLERVIVLFTAPWFGLDNNLREIFSENTSGQSKAIIIDVDTHPHIADRFRVDVIPTLLLIEKGSEQGRKTGAFGRAAILEYLSLLS